MKGTIAEAAALRVALGGEEIMAGLMPVAVAAGGYRSGVMVDDMHVGCTVIGRLGVGDYRIFFSNTLPSANYAVLVTVDPSIASVEYGGRQVNITRAADYVRVRVSDGASALEDQELITIVVWHA